MKAKVPKASPVSGFFSLFPEGRLGDSVLSFLFLTGEPVGAKGVVSDVGLLPVVAKAPAKVNLTSADKSPFFDKPFREGSA